MHPRIVPAIAGVLLSAVAFGQAGPASTRSPGPDDAANTTPPAAEKKRVLPPVPAEPAPDASPRHPSPNPAASSLPTLIARHFEGHVGRRLHLQVDKPLYRPGETIWFKAWDLEARTLAGAGSAQTIVELVSPKGAVVMKKRLRAAADGGAHNDFVLPEHAQGGEYTLRMTTSEGHTTDRGVIVSAFEAPRMKKRLEFVKKAYGAGETVSATVEVRRPTGEALAGKALAAVVTVDGVELPRVKVTTHADGGALLKFDLPATIAAGDGLLTVLVEDGGVTESISKSIPILQKRLALAFFPEGGRLVAGLPSRVYFEAKNLHGKPADVQGRIVDDLGNAITTFASVKNGLGRVAFTPATGRRYHAEVTQPSSITEKVSLPLAEASGCVLRSFDDVDGQHAALRVAVRCTEKQTVTVAATMRDRLIDSATVDASDDAPAVVHLRASDGSNKSAMNSAMQRAAGVARVTVFDHNLDPVAERLVFRNRRERLQVSIEPDRKRYAPRDAVSLAITTRDAAGKPVAAELALSVVDDTVVSLADDKTGHLLSKLLLEPELPGKVEEPNVFFDLSEATSGEALDLLMGARGWRRFEWAMVLRPVPPPLAAAMAGTADARGRMELDDRLRLREQPHPMAMPPAEPARPVDARAANARADEPRAAVAPRLRENQVVAQDVAAKQARLAGGAREERTRDAAAMVDKDFAGAVGKLVAAAPALMRPLDWAPVRVFPVPAFQPDYEGPRNDFRDTVFWAPSVKTGSDGKARVSFVLSDAVTSFRVATEGIAGEPGGRGARRTNAASAGLVGRDETVIASSLPFSLSAKLPLEVTAGDKPLIPITLANDGERALDVKLDSSFGDLMKPTTAADAASSRARLPAGERKSLFVPLDVTGARGASQVRLTAGAGMLHDEVLRSIPVAPAGFPQTIERSGQVRGSVSHDVDLTRATAGTVQATVRVYTSMLATTISGLEGMLREPNGCFEQTSSTNYPNVMIMQYLKQHDVADAALLERSGKLMDSGYKKLTGYESRNKGYEWFGGDPGHEALTAYGLMQFADMKDVYGAVDAAMVERTAAWLKSRRDGRGGYLRDAKALDSFGRASPEVTDAYITWALASAGVGGLDAEIAKSAKLAQDTTDAYQLALATGTLMQRAKGTSPSKHAQAAAAKLASMQDTSGAWKNADHSITRSGGSNLHIETTSLAVLALLGSDEQHVEAARKGVAWLQANRGGFGQWGATQSTVLALKALTRFDDATRVAPRAGAVSLLVDGVVVAEKTYEAGRREPLVFTGFDDKLAPGKPHTITLRSRDEQPLPYAMAVEYRSTQPTSSAAAAVKLDATLAKTAAKMGETVRLNATITNTSATKGQPMTLARLGLPGGLQFQNWQLKELREKGQIAFFETRPREVILYFRDMKPGETKTIGIDLVAAVPGSYTGPASSAYLYYDDAAKHWAAPLVVSIVP